MLLTLLHNGVQLTNASMLGDRSLDRKIKTAVIIVSEYVILASYDLLIVPKS